LTYVFPHVPKTGGTSLLKQFETSDLRFHADYGALRGARMKRKDAECARADFSDFDLIFGHFPIHRYRGRQYRYIALVRDPVDRCISSFKFYQLLGERFPDDHSFHAVLGRKILAGEVDFLEYVRTTPMMTGVYKHILGYWGRRNFELIGRTDRYGEFCDRLSNLLKIPISGEVHERKADRDFTISLAQRQRARVYLADEYRWFDRFTKDATRARWSISSAARWLVAQFPQRRAARSEESCAGGG
jgi:hypothetical protein